MNVKREELYLRLVNVPVDCLLVKTPATFVEVRGKLGYWDEETKEPKFFVEINNLSMLDAQNIIWDEFTEVVEELVSNYFKEFKVWH